MRIEQKHFFYNQFRDARAIALQDAEAFDGIVHVLERMGRFLLGESSGAFALNDLKRFILPVAEGSPLAVQIPSAWPDLHLSFSTLYELVREGRNKAMHEGAFARHLTTHAVELSIVLEHALMKEAGLVRHFMVENPVCAELWQPLSFIRQNMLKNSFSYLPVSTSEGGHTVWRLISDLALAQYFQAAANADDLRLRLSTKLETVVASKEIVLIETQTHTPDVIISNVLKTWKGLPAIIVRKGSNELIGILTPFDLL